VLRYWQPTPGRSELELGAIDTALRESPDQGLSIGALRDYARRMGFSAYVFQGSFADLIHEIGQGRPVIVGVALPVSSGEAMAHFQVFVGHDLGKRRVLILDPARGLRQNGLESFLAEWEPAGRATLVVIPDATVEEARSAGSGLAPGRSQ
jgi:predicted double-glycine peptidase